MSNSDRFTIVCPCCEATLNIDAETGALLSHEEKTKPLGSFEDMVKDLDKQKQTREHIMFKSTKNMKAEMMDRLTEDVGGSNNAFTQDDVTVYFEVIPSNYMETLLWAEAERLSALTVDEENFKSERAVVQEEFRQSV